MFREGNVADVSTTEPVVRTEPPREMMARRSACLPLFVLIGTVLMMPPQAMAGLRDDCETPEPAWRDIGGSARYNVERRERSGQETHSGAFSEFWQLGVLGGGTTLYLSYDLGQAPIIDETTASLWLRSDRPGMQLFARVVYPRTLDPQTGKPITALVIGTAHGKPGLWQRLTIANVREQVEQQARVLRVQMRIPIDTGQAYLDRLLLNVYAGTGRTALWIDDVEVTGVVRGATEAVVAAVPNVRTADDVRVTNPNVEAVTVEMRGQAMTVRGRPFFTRMIEHRGEPLTLLQRLGFNTVRLREAPSRELLDEAERLGLWLVCPPPRPADLENPYGAAPGGPEAFGSQFPSVLAWDLGEGWTAGDIDVLKRWAEYVRGGDQPRPRPLLCGAAADLRILSRHVDIVTADRRPLGTDCELSTYGEWLRDRGRLVRPGTPVWAVVQTQPLAEIARQAQLLATVPEAGTPTVESEQIRLLLYEALAGGARGILFASDTPLSAADPTTQARAATLHLLNLELELIDVWASSGNFVAKVPGYTAVLAPPPPKPKGMMGTPPPPTPSSDVSAAVLQIDRGHLLLPLWTGKGAQFVAGQSAGTNVSFIVPGVPETVEAYELTPGGMRPVRRQRVAGGLRITFDEFSLTSLVLLTQDPQVVAATAHRLNVIGATAAQRQREVVTAKLQAVETVQERLVSLAPPVRNAASWLTAARRSMQIADAQLVGGQLHDGYMEARRVLRPLALLEQAQWKSAVTGATTPMSDPFTSSFASLAEHWRMKQRLEATPNWENVLPGGDFENLEAVLGVGWRHYRHAQEGIRTEADLAGETRGAGSLTVGGVQAGGLARPLTRNLFSLRLAARPIDPEVNEMLVDSAPLWVTSPPVPVRAGQLLRCSGWIYVPQKVVGSVDGLTILDSIGGPALAQHYNQTGAWKEFRYYRVVPTDGSFTLTAALSGLGEAYLDDVTIEVVR